jgi:hypothetical protein
MDRNTGLNASTAHQLKHFATPTLRLEHYIEKMMKARTEEEYNHYADVAVNHINFWQGTKEIPPLIRHEALRIAGVFQ